MKIRYNIVLPSTPRFPDGLFPVGLLVNILKALLLLFILATLSAHLNLLDLITLIILAEWFLMVKHFPLPILIPLGFNYSPQDPVFRYP